MSKITIGTQSYETRWVETGSEIAEGVMRQALQVQLAPTDTPLDTINQLLADSKSLEQIQVENTNTGIEGSTALQIFEGYTIKRKISLEPFSTTTPDGVLISEERICFTLARKTDAETQAQKQQEQIDFMMEMLRNAGIAPKPKPEN